MPLKKYIAEFIGTAALVFFGCGTAMLTGCSSALGSGYILTALAFGLSVICMAYCIGGFSGCHLNPAVSLGILLTGKMKFKEFLGYIVSQIIGAIIASALLTLMFELGNVADLTGNLASNSLAGVNGNAACGLILEIVFTFVFVLVVLGATSKFGNPAVAGIVIGLTLTLVHILGIGLTGTSVNPARSIAPAVISVFFGNLVPISQLWVFVVAPLVGAALAAAVHRGFHAE